jgi:hypothetical protein
MMRTILLAVFAVVLAPSLSTAHSLYIPRDTSGVPIPALTHGQMTVIADHRREIETLATWVAPHDATVDKLLGFSRAQSARCLWGMMPRSIDDEASPFNQCSHAYLAADRELLLRAAQLPYWNKMATDLRDQVEEEMVQQGSSLVLCLFSATSFNTASLVNPDFHDFLLHVPTLLTLIAIFVTLAVGLAAVLTLVAGNGARTEAPKRL